MQHPGDSHWLLEAELEQIASWIESDRRHPSRTAAYARFLRRLAEPPQPLSGEAVSGEDRARLELIRDHDGNDLSENDKVLTRLAEARNG